MRLNGSGDAILLLLMLEKDEVNPNFQQNRCSYKNFPTPCFRSMTSQYQIFLIKNLIISVICGRRKFKRNNALNRRLGPHLKSIVHRTPTTFGLVG